MMPKNQLNQVLDAELGPNWSSKLISFDYEPIAAASIGQVMQLSSTTLFFLVISSLYVVYNVSLSQKDILILNRPFFAVCHSIGNM